MELGASGQQCSFPARRGHLCGGSRGPCSWRRCLARRRSMGAAPVCAWRRPTHSVFRAGGGRRRPARTTFRAGGGGHQRRTYARPAGPALRRPALGPTPTCAWHAAGRGAPAPGPPAAPGRPDPPAVGTPMAAGRPDQPVAAWLGCARGLLG